VPGERAKDREAHVHHMRSASGSRGKFNRLPRTTAGFTTSALSGGVAGASGRPPPMPIPVTSQM